VIPEHREAGGDSHSRGALRGWIDRFIGDLKSPPSGPRFRPGAMVAWPLLIALALTAWARFSGFDLGIQKLIYESGGGGWSLGKVPLWKCLYQWGTIPAAAVAFSALALYFLSWTLERFLIWRKVFLFIVLSIVIGPGIITNGLVKEYWGRPRPRDVIEFGGKDAFEPVFAIDLTSGGASFPCGHATMGFFFLGGYFLLRRHRVGLARGFLLGGISYGSLIGLARMAQGGHFFTDVIWAGLICYVVPMGLYYAMGLDHRLTQEGAKLLKRMPLWGKGATGGTALAMLAAVLMASPYSENRTYRFQNLSNEPGRLDLRFRFSPGEVDFSPSGRLFIRSESLGHGIPFSRVSSNRRSTAGEDGTEFFYAERVRGWFFELDSRATVEIPWRRVNRLELIKTAETRMRIELAAVPGSPVIEVVSGNGLIEIEPAGQQIHLVTGDTRLVEGVDHLLPGESDDGFYRLKIAPEFTGRVRLLAPNAE
jgi:lipid A 4'-phosphatase